VQEQRAQAASNLNVLRASESQVQRALDGLDSNVRAQQAAVASASQAVDAATVALDQARRREAEAAAQIVSLHDRAALLALDAYEGRTSSATFEALRSGNLADVARRREYLSLAMGDSTDALDRLRAARQDLLATRRAAQRAKGVAGARRAEVQSRLTALTLAQREQLKFAASVENKILVTTSQADQLAKSDAQLGAQVAAQQAQGATSIVVNRSSGSVPLTTVRGITVNTSIAAQLDKMLGAAQADGITFTGQGYRSTDEQIALRRAHCGSSDYAVYQMDPSQCSPPTARPGSSMHEQGLAVDFIANGSLVSSRSSPGYQWLAAHAAGYGFYNLPSEPWHWSINGH
jgi:LAS superfamily LD-carboxypeptidase LdcB